MSKPYRLLVRAEARLKEIADWTEDTFGPAQADLYGNLIEARLQKLIDGRVFTQTCDHLSGDPADADLSFIRVGEHLLIYTELEEEYIVLDLLHSRSDLPRHLTDLENPKDD